MSVKTRVRTTPVLVNGRYGDPAPKAPGPPHLEGIPLAQCRHNADPDFVYFESIKQELKIKPIYECRCDERLKTKIAAWHTLTLFIINR
jgi:hypothetical protein